jgi:hypothetical protein
MGTLGLVLFIVLLAGGIAWVWVRGIDNMQKNHPDYKGEDFLNWDSDDVTKTAGRDGWDDNLVHTEGGL